MRTSQSQGSPSPAVSIIWSHFFSWEKAEAQAQTGGFRSSAGCHSRLSQEQPAGGSDRLSLQHAFPQCLCRSSTVPGLTSVYQARRLSFARGQGSVRAGASQEYFKHEHNTVWTVIAVRWPGSPHQKVDERRPVGRASCYRHLRASQQW